MSETQQAKRYVTETTADGEEMAVIFGTVGYAVRISFGDPQELSTLAADLVELAGEAWRRRRATSRRCPKHPDEVCVAIAERNGLCLFGCAIDTGHPPPARCVSLSPHNHRPCWELAGHEGCHQDPGGVWSDAEAYRPTAENR